MCILSAVCHVAHRLKVASAAFVVYEACHIADPSGVNIQPEPAVAGGQKHARNLFPQRRIFGVR